MLRICAALLLTLTLFSSCGSLRDKQPKGRFIPARQTNDQIEREVFRQVNAYRRSRGLAMLAYDPALATAARDHSRSMAARKKMSHAGFDRRFRRLRPAGFRGLAENVAMNLGLADPARVAVEGWRRSSGHHKNMISRKHPFTGIGVARGRDGSVYLTQLFGSR